MPFTFAERFCPICRTNDAASLLAEANYDPSKLDEFAFASRKTPEYMHWRLWECGRCDLVFANPAPPAEQLGMLYQDAAFSSSKEAALASRTYAAVLRKKVTPRLEDRVGALDIGTGDGVFLQHLLDG